MAISFNNVPANIRVPFAYFELNAGVAPYQSNSRLLIIAQKLAAGKAVANEPILVTGSEDALFGYGSHAAIMYRQAANTAPFQEIWVAPLDDAAASVAATATIDVSGAFPVSAAGTIALYIGGVRIQVGVTTADTAANLAAKIASAINNSIYPLECTAAVNGSTPTRVDLTARNKGTVGNGIRLSVNLNTDDGIYGRTLLTLSAFSGGATDPALSTVLANCANDLFDFITAPYTGAGTISTIESFLDARWLPSDSSFGHFIGYLDGTAAALQTYGAARNSPNVTIYGGYRFESSPIRIAAALAARHAQHLQAPPELSRPLQTLSLPGIRGPKALSDRFGVSARNTLLYNGISTLNIERDGTVAIDRAITMYQTNAYGAVDTSWLSVNTRAQQVYGLRYLKSYITNTFPRCALVDDNPSNIQNFATASDIRDALVHAYQNLVELGVFENAETFEQLLQVERDPSDPNRVNAYIPTDAVNQLIIFAGNVESWLQFPTQR